MHIITTTMNHAIHIMMSLTNKIPLPHWLNNNQWWQMLGKRQLVIQLSVVISFLELINIFCGHLLSRVLGTRPRTIGGLAGLVFSPFLHWDIAHYLSNIIPFTVLGCLMMGFGPIVFFKFLIYSILFEGLFVWLLGRPNMIAVGTSGLIFSMLGYIITHAIITKNTSSIAYAVIAVALYGGALLSIGGNKSENICIEGHVGGLLSGIAIAYWLIH